MNYERVNWENGTEVEGAYVEIDGTRYPVVMPTYNCNTPITARNLNIMDKGIDDAFKYIEEQEVLWEGSAYMYEGQSAILSKNISSMKNGVVLVFCGYREPQVNDNNFECYYVPKKLVQLKPGVGHMVFLGGTSELGYKYIYIHNNKIIGHANNASTSTISGVTYNNRLFVLRYVIGI